MWISSVEFQKKYNISPQLFYLWKKNGKIKTKELVKGHSLVWDEDMSAEDRSVAVYARVSTPKQREDLDNQINVLRSYSVSNGASPKVFSDIGSGMNESRPGLNELITEITKKKISKVIVSHKDRLARFGFGYLESVFKLFGTEIEIVNLEDDKSFQQELTEDLISIIHHFSMRFYGKMRNKIIKLKKELEDDDK